MSYILSSKEKVTGCVFCEKPACADDRAEFIVLRGVSAYAMLNLYPYNNGHLLIAPYQHCASIEDLDASTLTEIMLLSNQSLTVLRQALKPQGFNLGINLGKIAGAGIAEHVHLHIVPRWNADTNYMSVTAGTRVIPEALEDTYDQIMAVVRQLNTETPGRQDAG